MVATTSAGFEGFFRSEHQQLVALGLALTGNRESALELAQEALSRAYRAWPKIATFDNPGGWARRVVINLANDLHRSRGRERAALERVPPAEPALLDDPMSDHWWRVVRSLPDRQRAAVALHYLEDMSVADVATTLGVTEGTVKASLAHARRSLIAHAAEEER